MSTFSKLVVIDGLVYQEIRDYNGKLLFCRRYIADQHPPEHRPRDMADDFKKFNKKLDDLLSVGESVSFNLKVKEKPLPLKPFYYGPPPVKIVPEEVDFSEDDDYYFSYVRPAGTLEFSYGKMSTLTNTLTDELVLVPRSSPKSPGADYGLSQDAKDSLSWKEFITDNNVWSNLYLGNKFNSPGSNPLYEHRPLTWKEIENMEDTITITKKEKYNEKS